MISFFASEWGSPKRTALAGKKGDHGLTSHTTRTPPLAPPLTLALPLTLTLTPTLTLPLALSLSLTLLMSLKPPQNRRIHFFRALQMQEVTGVRELQRFEQRAEVLLLSFSHFDADAAIALAV